MFLRGELEEILNEAARPLFAYEIVRAQQRRNPVASSILVQNEILAMLRDQVLTEDRKRYRLKAVRKPNLFELEDPKQKPSWDSFRALCSYYLSCLRAREGAEAIASLQDNGSRFIGRPMIGVRSPQLDLPWRLLYPLDPFLASFLTAKKADDAVIFGYPVMITDGMGADRSEQMALPVFCIRTQIEGQGNRVELSNENPFIFINPKFIEALKLKGFTEERIRAFRDATGDANPDLHPGFKSLADTLRKFFPSLTKEKSFDPNEAASFHLSEAAKGNLLVNSAVLMLARRPTYSLRLINELAQIAKADDEVLEGTALSAIFGSEEPSLAGSKNAESVNLVAGVQLSYSQQRAADAIILAKLSTITGPKA